jgi:hypothetical protein
VAREGAESCDDALGVELRAGECGVGVRVAEERVDGGFTHSVIAAGDDLVEVDEGDVLVLRHGVSPATVGVGVAADAAIDPDLAGNERAEDGRCAFGADVLDILSQVPAEGVDELGLMGELVLDFEGLITGAGKAAAGVGAARRCTGPGR